MNRKVHQTIFVFIFLAILYVAPFYWLFDKNAFLDFSAIENRGLATFPVVQFKNLKISASLFLHGDILRSRDVFFNIFLGKTWSQDVAKAASDQFPQRFPLILTSRRVDNWMIDLAYQFVNDPILPADTHNNIYVMRDASFFVDGIALFNSRVNKTIDERINDYNKNILEHPDQNFYLFYHELLPNSPYHPLIDYYSGADSRQGLQYFKENLPKGLKFDQMLLSGIENYRSWYFKTDHHMTIQGTWAAYEHIYALLAQDKPGFSPKLVNNGFARIQDLGFLGSFARKSLHPFRPEDFYVTSVNFPEYRIILKGEEIKYNHNDQYLGGIFSKSLYANHYSEFYGEVTPLIEYINDQTDGQNILVIGSSYMIPLEPIIAAHYNHSYFVDMRRNQKFSLDGFLKDHQINDILIIGDDLVAFADDHWLLH